MTAQDSFSKRKADAAISPPPIKRKIQSNTTSSAVASFFTPTSKKPKDRTSWSERAPKDDVPATLLVGRYEPKATEDNATNKESPRRKVAAFDLDSTLIKTSSGKKHAGSATDWQWWDPMVPGRLRQLHEEGYSIVILSNQAGLTLHFDANHKGPKASAQKRVADFKQKCSAVLSSLDLPVTLYAATAKDIYRKPRTGMWEELCKDYGLTKDELDLAGSVFVGDAGGRTAGLAGAKPKAVAKDFSCSDRNLAHNVGIDYKTPEEFFLDEKPRTFAREFDLAHHPFAGDEAVDGGSAIFEKKNKQDLVVFCGPPGAGKSTFFWTCLKPLGYERVNQDILKTREKCVQAAKEFLQGGKSAAVDNTNADPETRAVWIELAKKSGVPVRCVWFRTPLHVCEHNDAVRANNAAHNPEGRQGLPQMAFTGFASRHKEPQVREGFQDVVEVQFRFRGTREEYDVWGRYWA